MTPLFLSVDDIKHIHSKTLPQSGKCKINLLEGAINRVHNLFYYKKIDDIYSLAAMYLISIAKSHAFHDGNKRTAFQAASIFLMMNGSELSSSLLLVKLTVFASMDKSTLQETAFALKLLSNHGNEWLNDYDERYL